jgi:hypothetical protein
VRTTLVVIFLVRVEQMAEMLLAKDHDVIEAVPPDRSDQSLGESAETGRSRVPIAVRRRMKASP